jgi:hypothetical protein
MPAMTPLEAIRMAREEKWSLGRWLATILAIFALLFVAALLS